MSDKSTRVKAQQNTKGKFAYSIHRDGFKPIMSGYYYTSEEGALKAGKSSAMAYIGWKGWILK